MHGGCREPLPVGCRCGCSPGQGNSGGAKRHDESFPPGVARPVMLKSIFK